MAAEIVIIWPDPRWAGNLHSALLRGDLRASVQMLTRYPAPAELEEMLRQEGGDAKVLVVGLTDEQRAGALFQAARDAVPEIGLVAADTVESTEGLRAAMRAGAGDYWCPPFDSSQIVRSLGPLLRTREASVAGTLIAFVPGQPGDGASTAALHVADAISAGVGQTALLIDCDLQCGTLGFRLGLSPKYSILDAAGNTTNLDDIWDRLATPWNDIRLLTAPESSFGLTGEHLDSLPGIVESALGAFPFVVVDLPAALYGPCAGVLRRADKVCLVCAPEITSLHLTRRRFSDFREWDLSSDKIDLVVNRADSRKAPPRHEIERSLGMPVAWNLPNSYEDITTAALEGRTVSSEAPYGQGILQMAGGLAGFEAHPARSSWKKLLSFG